MITVERLRKNAVNALMEQEMPCSVIFIDIDFFLRYCMKFPINVCGTVMRRISAFFHAAFENMLLLYEEGGDEFLVICPNKDAVAAENLVLDTLRAFRRERFFKDCFPGETGYESIRMTFSAGVAGGSSVEGAEETLSMAYTALLLAKSQRRNSVVRYGSAEKPIQGKLLLDPELPLRHAVGLWGHAGCSSAGAAKDALLWEPQAIAASSAAKTLYLADQNNHRILMIRDSRVSVVFGGAGYGTAKEGRLNKPTALCAAGDHLLIADTGSDQILLLENVAKTGAVRAHVICGTENPGYDGDGGPAALASLNKPGGIAQDKYGNLYISDIANNVIRRISVNGLIETPIGSGKFGFSGDGGSAADAAFQEIYGIGIDRHRDVLYIADYLNHRIRAYDIKNGRLRTAAGGGKGGRGDGGDALNAVLDLPTAVCTDDEGNLYIAESGSHSVRVVRNRDGRIFTLAGGLGGGFSPAGMAADTRLANPNSLCVDRESLFILDGANSRVLCIPLSRIWKALAAV